MKQIGSPTTLGAHGFKGRRRVRARGRPLGISAALNRRLREKTSGTQRNPPTSPTRYRYTVLLHLSSHTAITGDNKSGQSRNFILLNAEEQIVSSGAHGIMRKYC